MNEPFDTTTHRYRVRGTDEEGDVLMFLSNDEARARDMFRTMKGDLESVVFEEPVSGVS